MPITLLPITVDEHPLLEVSCFFTRFPAELGEMETPAAAVERLARVPAPRPEVDAAVRAMLRVGGFKPSGRSKPASEYLVRAAGEGTLGSINLAVDLINVLSLESGLPISVVDVERAEAPFRIALGQAGARYVFNASGQEIEVGGLISLWDSEGPCGGPVKDGLRTKTGPRTRETLSVVWGSRSLPGRAAAVAEELRALLDALGAVTTPATIA